MAIYGGPPPTICLPPKPAIIRPAGKLSIPVVRQAAGMGVQPIVPPLVRAATITFTDNTPDGADLTTYSFTTQSFGAATSSDHIVLVIGSRAVGARTISSVTIDGQTGSQQAFVDFTVGGGHSINAIYIADATGNATGTVSITFSAGMIRCGIGVYVVTGLHSSTASDTDTQTGNNPSGTLNIPAGGVAVGGVYCDSATVWTNLTENYDEIIESPRRHTGASAAFAAEQTALSISTTSTTNVAMTLASFR